MSLPILSTKESAPWCITDRFGEWHCPPAAPEIVKELASKFIDAFGSEPGVLKDGDPRLLMSGNETTFLAVKEGRFGVMTEVELGFAECDENYVPPAGDPTEGVLPDEFAIRVQEWSGQLEKLAPSYKDSEFFLSHGEFTFDGRLCLNAFTPVEVGWGCRCVDPYREHGKSLDRLDESMNAIPYAAPCTLEYDRHGADGNVTSGLETEARIYMGSAHRRIITEHFLDGEIAGGNIIPTGAIYCNKRFDVQCNGDEIAAVGQGIALDDRPATKEQPKP